jgi:hypothetical protein
LRTQRNQFQTQLDTQAGALDKQLAAQADGIREQAARQSALASQERELAARAELLVSVQEKPIGNRIAAGLER